MSGRLTVAVINMMGYGQIRQLQPKKTPISDDYRLTGSVLGLGINGKVHVCYSRSTQQKFALKVGRAGGECDLIIFLLYTLL